MPQQARKRDEEVPGDRFEALGDPGRRSIVELLGESPRSVAELAAEMPRGRYANYAPPVMETLGLAEVEHNPRNNRMRAI